jgi:hypothetical protein
LHYAAPICDVEVTDRCEQRQAAGQGCLNPSARCRSGQAIAEAENRAITNYVETALIRDLAQRDEAARVITIRAAAGTSSRINPQDVVRAPDESDLASDKRRDLLIERWSIPDSDEKR